MLSYSSTLLLEWQVIVPPELAPVRLSVHTYTAFVA